MLYAAALTAIFLICAGLAVFLPSAVSAAALQRTLIVFFVIACAVSVAVIEAGGRSIFSVIAYAVSVTVVDADNIGIFFIIAYSVPIVIPVLHLAVICFRGGLPEDAAAVPVPFGDSGVLPGAGGRGYAQNSQGKCQPGGYNACKNFFMMIPPCFQQLSF